MPPFTILSFCGGGIRGLLSSTILSQLKFPQNGDKPYADLLAGCSTGATIVSWLVNGESPERISQLYQTQVADFYSRQATDPQAPSYSADLGLYGQRYLQENPILSPSPWENGTKVSDLAQSVLLTSFSIGGQAQQYLPEPGGSLETTTPPWGGSMFTNLAVDEHRLVHDSNTTITGDIEWPEAVVGSGGMPGEIGTVSWTGTTLTNPVQTTFAQADGAFFNHDPTFPAIAAAMSSGVHFEDIYVICFGTGLCPNWIASDTAKWGAGQWQNGDGNPNSYTPSVFMNGTISPIQNLLLNGPCTTQYQDLALMMLGEHRYVYLDARFDTFIAENDVSLKTLQYMIDKGTPTSSDSHLAKEIARANEMIAANWGAPPA